MKRVVPIAVLIALVMSGRVRAHQLDEYLQAARIAFARDRVVLEVDLTPGANISSAIVAAIDPDGDGVVGPLEARGYGEAVAGHLDLSLDGRPVRLALSSIEVPSVNELRDGTGTMRLTVIGVLDGVQAGTHHVRFNNSHQPVSSVYLANALIPVDTDVQVVAQRRDRHQRQIDVEYRIASGSSVPLVWVLFGATVLVSRIGASRAVVRRILSYTRVTRTA
jgi:hypothetical protein